MKNRKTKIAVAAAVSLIAAGTGTMAVSAYLSGNQFQPGTFSQLLQANQIVFPEDADKAGKKESDSEEESSVWEKVDDAEREEQPKSTGGAGYLLENGQEVLQTSGDNLSIASSNASLAEGAAQGGAVTAAAAAAAGAGGDTSYRLVGDPTEADLVIRAPEGASSGAGSTGAGSQEAAGTEDRRENGNGGSFSGRGNSNSSGSSGNGGTASSGKKDDLVLEPDPGKKPDAGEEKPGKTDPVSGKEDPVMPDKKPKPAGLFDVPAVSFPSGGIEKDDVGRGGVVISKGYLSDYCLYRGQKITEKSVFYALETYVWGKDNSQYAWGDRDYDHYIRIDGISFDGGKTWKTFPVQIPEDVDSSQVVIKASYRLNEKSAWTEKEVPYEVEDNRILVLSQKCKDKDNISSDIVLNTDGSRQYLTENARLNLYGLQNGLLSMEEKLTSLFPGWEENGEQVPWLYPATSGLHILEPMDPVPLDSSAYLVYMKSKYLDDMEDAFGISGFVGVFQTLTGFNSPTFGWDLPDLEVPEYIQMIDFTDEEVWLNAIGTISVPDTVLYINTASESYYVNEAWKVSEDNPCYFADKEGVLYNKKGTQILGIPYEKKSLTVPTTIEKVVIPYYCDLKELRLEAKTEGELPDIDCANLMYTGCNVVLNNDSLMDAFLKSEMKYFTEESGNTVSSSEEPENRYFLLKDGSVINKEGEMHSCLTSGTSTFLSEKVKSVEKQAFRNSENLQILWLCENGQTVEFQKNSLADSAIRQIMCYSQEQYDSTVNQLKKAGGSGIEVVLIETKTNKEGYQYFQQETAEGVLTTLKKAPRDVVSFDSGALTDDEGNALVINSISAEAFEDCTQLQWVELAEDTKKIGAYAFNGCTALEGVLIEATDTIEIGDQSFEKCPSLRFLASNARECVRENDYAPDLSRWYNDYYQSFFFIPSYTYGYGDRPEDHGYPSYGVTSFTPASNVSSYQMVKTGRTGRVLYGAGQWNPNVEYGPWLTLCAGEMMDETVTLPSTTVEIFSYTFAETKSEGSTFTVNWDELSNLKYLDAGAFQNSSLGGEISLSCEGAVLGDLSLAGCPITSVQFSCVGQIGESAFSGCSELEKVSIASAAQENYLTSYAFTGCDKFREIELQSSDPVLNLIYWYTNVPFHFNLDWSEDEELEKVRIRVPEGTELTFVESWLYSFTGQEDYDGLKRKVKKDLENENPSNEEVLAECERRLLAAENRIRTHLGMETVDKLTFPPEELQDLNSETSTESLDGADAKGLKEKAAATVDPDTAGTADTAKDGLTAGSDEGRTENPAADGSGEGVTENPAAGDSGENISGEGSGEDRTKADASAGSTDTASSENSSSEENGTAGAEGTDAQSDTQEDLQGSLSEESDS